MDYKLAYQEFAEWVRMTKGDTCVHCGETFPFKLLHFHHTDPDTKLFMIGKGFGRSLEMLEAEVAKCIVLCAGCHRREEPNLPQLAT